MTHEDAYNKFTCTEPTSCQESEICYDGVSGSINHNNDVQFVCSNVGACDFWQCDQNCVRWPTGDVCAGYPQWGLDQNKIRTNYIQLNCVATEVAYSNYAATASIAGYTGQTRSVTCNVGYSGGGTATCGTSGTFNSLTCTASSCTATQVSNSDFAAAGSINGVTGQVSGPIPSGSLLFLDSLWLCNFILSSAL